MAWLIALQVGFDVWMVIMWLRQHWRDTEFELAVTNRLDRLDQQLWNHSHLNPATVLSSSVKTAPEPLSGLREQEVFVCDGTGAKTPASGHQGNLN